MNELKQDIHKRIKAVQALMYERQIGVLFLSAHGAPGMMGTARYFSNLQLWAGPAWLVLGADSPEPALIIPSSYAAEWNIQEAATSWVESPEDDPLGRAMQIAQELMGQNKTMATADINTTWKPGDWRRVQTGLLSGDREMIDLSAEIGNLRSVKSDFERREIYRTGRLLCEAFERFSETARPGVRCWEAAASAEQLLRSHGCFWGRSKYSFDLRPQTYPPLLERRFSEADIFVFELVYAGPLGYWDEMTALFSFKSLPDELEKQLETQQEVIRSCAAVMKPGEKIGIIDGTASKIWQNAGFEVIGNHTPHCHGIGLDGTEGISSLYTPDQVLIEHMVLSFHPSSLLRGNRAFLLSDNYEVTGDGAVPLSPKNWFYRQLEE